MAMNWGVTDILAVTKLAWDLYHKCYLVAREAPDDFRNLVNELASLQSVLRTVRDDINSDVSFMEKLGENRKETLERCLSGCFDTLRRLQKLVIKYQDLGSANNLSFWQRIRWVTEQRVIADLKARIMAHTCSISLCMTSIGNSSLSRIEGRLREAMDQQARAPDLMEMADEMDELTPLNPPGNTSGHGSAIYSQASAVTTLYEPTKLRAESSPSPSDSSFSEFDAPKSMNPSPHHKTAPGIDSRQRHMISVDQDTRALSFSSTALDENLIPPSIKSGRSQTRSFATLQPVDQLNGNMGFGIAENQTRIVEEAVADARKELLTVRQRELSSRPLKVTSQDPDRTPDPALRARFQKSADDEMKYRRLNARDWLRVATWWLLKAKNNMQTIDQPEFTSSRGSLSIPGDARSPANQAYVDLLKASWILHTMILREENVASLRTDENRKLYQDLSDGIKDEFSKYQPADTPEKETFSKQNCDIWEDLQPEEEKFDDNDFLLGMDNGRWITLEQEDAGDESEKVLFRTFVNAAIGSRRVRFKSKGAPYMLILSTKDGESEPRVSLCNQSGTLCLTRAFTIEDLQEESATSQFAGATQLIPTEAIPFKFERTDTAIAFTNNFDFEQFMRLPRAYFDAVKNREPRRLERATESLIFKRSVEIYERCNPSTLKRLEPPERFLSCDLRVLETTTREGWRTTRRLVISSSAAEKKPWLIESFLPLGGVQIQREKSSRQMLIRWSDCSNETKRTDGNYNPVWSYIYDDSNPNIALSLSFRSTDDATDFERKVLQLSSTPVFFWSTSLVSGAVYTVSDADPNPRTYKALWLTHTRYQWKYSDVFFMYRDTDFQYDHAATRVRFPQATYPHYISSHVDKLYQPMTPAQFSFCEKRVGNVVAEFDNASDCMAFMSSLSSQHTLLFSRRASQLTTKAPPRFGTAKSNKGPAEVQLWRKGNSIRLLSRWGDHVEEKWISMAVPKNGLELQRDSNRATFPKLEYDRGRKMDMANLIARDSTQKVDKKTFGHVAITFNTVREFAAALDGAIPLSLQRSAIEDLMSM